MNDVSEQKSYFELVDSAKLSVRAYSRNHKHSDCEILCVLSGNVSVTVQPQGKCIKLSKGDVLVIPQGVLHIIEKDHSLSVFASLKVDASDVRSRNSIVTAFGSALNAVSAEYANAVLISADAIRKTPFDKLFRICIEEKEKAAWGYRHVEEMLILNILVGIVRHWKKIGAVDDGELSSGRSVSIYSVCDYIESHFDEQDRVETLAKMCGMSYTHFARKFKELYGEPCKGYIEKVRIKKAKQLLLETNHDLSFISQELGFSDCSHLIRIFKRYEGITPKQYRVREKRK